MTKKINANDFDKQIRAFNALYMLPVLDTPGIPFVGTVENTARQQFIKRMQDFHKILTDELTEVGEIVEMIKAGEPPVEVLTALADWLGDIQVYCASEMRKFGLDNSVILSTIMSSNMSKLGKDGFPIYDDTGKVMKGPDYWRPEPMIRKYIQLSIKHAEAETKAEAEAE